MPISNRQNIARYYFCLLFFLCCTFFYAGAQNVVRVEYFVDTDPGFGNGFEAPIGVNADNTNIEVNFQFDISTLSNGFHNLYIRSLVNPYQVVEDGQTITKGGWSLTQVRTFYKETVAGVNNQLTNINAGEYFIDTDPGFGNGSPIPIAPNAGTNITDLNFTFDITNLTTGFHNLYVRFKDANGTWSHVNVRTLYKENITGANNQLPDIVSGEFYMDTDPGFGNGSPIQPLSAASDITNANFTIDITALSVGFHNLYVRFKDANGVWSHANTRTFYKENITTGNTQLPNITAGEYFVDTDPGFGNANKIVPAFTAGVIISDLDFTVDITGLAAGFHNIYVRFRDVNGTWSHASIRSFYKETFSGPQSLPNIVSLEYFVDTDPGFGKGSPVSVNAATNISTLTFPIDMTNVSIGNHLIYVRALDAEGKWSLVSSGSFIVEPSAAIYMTVGTLEAEACVGSSFKVPFLVNIPYGSNNVFTAQLSDANGAFGNPVNIGSFTGNNNDTIRCTIPANTTAGSAYRVRVLASSPLDTSAASSISFFIKRVPEQSFIISGKVQPCIGTETYAASVVEPGATTYTWVLSGGGTMVTNGAGATVNWTTAGNYTLSLTASNSCGAGVTRNLSITVYAAPPTISANGPLTFCQGSSVVLTSSSPTGNIWSTGATSQSITVTNSGTYTLSLGAGGCSTGNPETAEVTVNSSLTPTFTAIAPLCAGSTVPILPAISNNGIAGTWSPSVINNTASGTYTFTATPTAGQCFLPATLLVTITPIVTPVFAAIPPIAAGSVAPVLSATSQNGISGTWNPAIISNTQTGSYTFTPNNAGPCIGSVTVTIVVLTAPDLAVQSISANKTVFSPNELVTLSWNVANIGSASSFENWNERIYIQSPTGENRTLVKQADFISDGIINIGQSLARSTDLNMPSQLNIGDQGVFVVEIIPGNNISEVPGAIANNTGIQAIPWSINRKLSLLLSSLEITEGSLAGISVSVNRTGSLDAALTVNLSLQNPVRFSFPPTITIPAGQSGYTFNLTVPDNNLIEGNLTDRLDVTATGFQATSANLLIIDNDKPTLTITNLVTEVMEGNSITFQVNTNLASSAPMLVYLSSNNQVRFPVPPSVTITAGALSAAVTINLVQDNIPEIDQAVGIIAGAGNHISASGSILVKDDDVPGLELIIKTNLISESAGFFATEATLRRKSNSNPIAFTANLSAGPLNTLILPSSITLAAGENEKTFTIGVIDNSLADGQRDVSVSAAIFVSSCGCSAPPSSAGFVTASVTVSDNDGPSLQLTANPLTLSEGMTNAGTLRITRNTPGTQAQIVNLLSSNTNEVTLPATATIPVGAGFVEVPISTINDGITDGSQQVNIQASATGFSTGAVWVIVTDLNKPDLVITAATVNNPTIQALTIFDYKVSVRNTGFATAPAGVLVRGYLSLDNTIDPLDSLISENVIEGGIGIGQTVQILNAVTAPNLPGQYKLLYWVNPDAGITELLYSNNTAQPTGITILPDYTATASINLPYFLRGSSVPINGAALKSNGAPAANSVVEIYIITNGLRRKILATTDALGNYNTQFVPLSNEVGHYVVGASFPGINATIEQDAFDILGIRINGGNIPQFKVILNDTLKGTLSVQNLSNKSLANFTLAPVDLPGGATIQFETAALFAGNSTINLAYKALGKSLSPGSNFVAASMNATANEGVIQPVDVFYFCQAPNAYVEADITKISISTSQSQGERLVEFRLVNKGVGETGKLTINLPQVNWLSSITPKEVTNLSSGDTLLVVLKFMALTEVPFNFPITGNIGINTLNGNSFSIPYSFEKVSETNGAVKVTVTDQFTFYSDAAPNVKGARVIIKNYFSGAVYAEGLTDDNGKFLVGGIPEGTHRISVDKEKHEPYNGTITINPGDTIESTVFINYQAITFNWNVVPTAVQDVYDITLTTKFETNVPMPVVTIDMPTSMPKLTGTEVYAFNVTLTNHGLIAAKDVALNLPQTDPEYEFITNYTPADLLAQQSIQIPVLMRIRTNQGGRAGRSGAPSYEAISKFLGINPPMANKTTSGSPSCQDFTGIVYWYKCSLSSGLWEQGGVLFTYEGRTCTSGPGGGGGGINYPIFTGSGGGGTGFPPCAFCPVIPGGTGTGTTPAYTQEKKSCVQCLNDLAQAILGCLGVNIPPEIGCGASGLIDKGGPKSYALCVAKGYAESLASKIPYISQLLCIKALLEALETCLASAQGRPSNSRNALKPTAGNAVFQEFADNLHVIERAYRNRIAWNTEYFGDLSLNDSWKEFYRLISIHVDNLTVISANEQADIIAKMAGYDMPSSAIQQFFTRWNKSIQARDQDILLPNAQYPDIINWTLIKTYSDSLVDAHNYSVNKGFGTIENMRSTTDSSMNAILDEQKNAVCASVTVQFSQQLTMTREAFEGTLEISNGHPSEGMDSLSVTIQITDENGVPGNGLFEIQTKSLTNLANITGTGKIPSQQKGSVKFLFIPELLAAPTAPKIYNFGGSVRYWDPYAQAMVTLPLSSVALTVNPSPNLYLHYFMQRNILGDDALTSPAIEPSIPAELAVMVENQGYGPAVNMTISSAQPKIVENEKGLAINFNLIGSNFQGKPTNFGVNNINFGTIPGLQTRIGQWYFTSSLLGKFVSYDAKVVHANSFGNPDLSLVKGVKLHELTKSIRLYGTLEDGINDFLVNDIFDVADQPDIIYFSQGNRTENVVPATIGIFSSPVSAPAFTNTLTVTASDTGWNYIKLNDPGNNKYELLSVTRSDGQVIPLNNAWLTFVTLPVSRPPLYENKFHFVDSFASRSPVTYTVVWKPANTNVPKITNISGVPSVVVSSKVENLTVVFDKAIDPSTFTYEDLTLTFQGGPNIMNSSVVITQLDTATFKVDISSLTNGNGFYAFTAQAGTVQDIYGINGATGKQVTWTQFLTVPTVQAYMGLPAGNIASAFDTIGVLFNLAIDKTTVTPQSFAILKDGVTQPGALVIDSVRADNKLFYLSGLKNILTQSGAYQLVVDLPNIKSVNQIAGLQKDSVTLIVDNAGPVVLGMEKSDSGSIDLQHVSYVNIKFDENVVGFNTGSVKLTRNGEILPLNIAQLLNIDFKNWKAGNFGLLTYPEGVYTFTIDLSGFTDANGNKGTGKQQITWTVNRSILISITNLAVGPDLGFSGTDGITSVQSLVVNFDLGSNASQVTITQLDLSGETVLLSVPNVAAGNVSIPVTLLTGGNTGIKVTVVGALGGVGMVQKALFIDQTPLTAQWLFADNQQISVQPDNMQLSFSSKLLNNSGLLNSVQFRRNGAILPTTALLFDMLNDSLFNLNGLRQVSSIPGNYELRFNLQPFSKYRSGRAGNGIVTVSWTVQSSNLPPIARAGNDITITATGIFKLNGAGSSDPESGQLTYKWVAPEGLLLDDSTLASPSFTITAANNGKTYSFLLIVSDGALFTTDVVDVIVNITAPAISFTGLSNGYCADAGAVTLTGFPAGGTFSGIGITGNSFDPAFAGVGTHTIMYSKDGQTFSQATIVNPLPAAPTITEGTTVSFCKGSSVTLSTGQAAAYLWSPGGLTSQSINVSSGGNYSVTVKNIFGCSSVASAVTLVTMNQLPLVTLADFISVCHTSPAFALGGGRPSGGVYSGNGVINGHFDPAVSGIGTFSITYTFTNGNGCIDSVKRPLTVTPMPNQGPDLTRYKCQGLAYSLEELYSNPLLDYTSLTEAFTPVLNPASVEAGIYKIIANNKGGCADTLTITVVDQAKPDIGADITLYHTCAGEFTNLDALYNVSGLNAIWNTVNSVAAPPGTYRLIVNNIFGCQDTAFVNIILESATWTGITSNDWHTGSNWSTNKVPTLSTHVIVPAGTPNPCLISTADAVAASVQLKNGSVFEIGGNRKLLLAQKCNSLPNK